MDSLTNVKESKENIPTLSCDLKNCVTKVENTFSTTEVKNRPFVHENESVIKSILNFAVDHFKNAYLEERSDESFYSVKTANLVADTSTSEATTSSSVTKRTLSLFCQNELKDMLQNILKRNLKNPDAYDESFEAVRTLSQNISNLSQQTIKVCESCILTIYRNNSLLKVISQNKSEGNVSEEEYFEVKESFES